MKSWSSAATCRRWRVMRSVMVNPQDEMMGWYLLWRAAQSRSTACRSKDLVQKIQAVAVNWLDCVPDRVRIPERSSGGDPAHQERYGDDREHGGDQRGFGGDRRLAVVQLGHHEGPRAHRKRSQQHRGGGPHGRHLEYPGHQHEGQNGVCQQLQRYD